MNGWRTAAAVLVGAALLAPAAVNSEIVAVTDDSYVRMESPDSNHGTSQLMQVRNRYGNPTHDDNFEYESLVQFQLSDIPYGSEIDSAVLYVYYYNYGGANPAGRSLTCHRATSPWNEMSVTWATRPSFEAEPASAATVPAAPGAWLAFDVTADLQPLTDPYGDYGWVIRDTTRWGAVSIPTTSLRTSEYGGVLAPYLEIEAGDAPAFAVAIAVDYSFPRWEQWDWGLSDSDIVPDNPTPFVGEPVTITASVHNFALCQARSAHGWYSPLGRSCWGEWDFATARADTVDISFRCRDNYDVDWRVELDGLFLSTITVPSVGDTNIWNIVTIRDVPMAAGRHRIFLGTYQMDYDPDYFLDWIEVGDTHIEAETYDRTGGNDPDGDKRGLTIEPRACDPPDSSRVTVQLWDGDPDDGGTLLVEDFVGLTNIVADIGDDYPANYHLAHYIPSNGSADLAHIWTPADTDTHEFYIIVDPGSLLPEINETNNVAVLRIAAQLREYSISQSFPNPAGPELEHGPGGTPVEAGVITQITYSIPNDAEVELVLYNVRGERVRTLASGMKDAGSHTVFWDGRLRDGERAASGVYFYRFTAGDYEATRKLVVVR
jgi:hypothetical protein